MSEPVWMRFLRDLADHPEGRTTTDLAYLRTGATVQARQTRVGNQLHKLRTMGYARTAGWRHVERAGKAKKQPCAIWEITDKGREAMRDEPLSGSSREDHRRFMAG